MTAARHSSKREVGHPGTFARSSVFSGDVRSGRRGPRRTPGETRRLMVRDKRAVLSPGWSAHAGAGARNCRLAWGMGGENRDFADLDPLALADLV
jgi:hypothetical protein